MSSLRPGGRPVSMLRAVSALIVIGTLACRREPPPAEAGGGVETGEGQRLTVRDTVIPRVLEVAGIAGPFRESTLGTKLMGAVTEVAVLEGQQVRADQLLARIDARDLTAKRAQTEAAIEGAEAMHRDAEIQAARFRALYADSAATKAQLDAAETGLARATATLASARAALAEVQAAQAYAEVRAPFNGSITRRFVDPGAFVAPGTPLLSIQDASRLRIAVTVAPNDARGLRRGDRVPATIEGQPVSAIIEGVVPATSGALYTVNALIENPGQRFPPGGAATLLLPRGTRAGILIPEGALVRQGDLTGVRMAGAGGLSELRWLRVGRSEAGYVEVLSGLRAGETIIVPVSSTVTGER